MSVSTAKPPLSSQRCTRSVDLQYIVIWRTVGVLVMNLLHLYFLLAAFALMTKTLNMVSAN